MEDTYFTLYKTLDDIDLKESYFYLDAQQEEIIRKWKGADKIIPQLPCWVSQRFVSVQLFGKNATNAIEKSEQHNGPGIWATQFSNVHSTFNFQEPEIKIDNEVFGGKIFF